jgi:hypothetical protein
VNALERDSNTQAAEDGVILLGPLTVLRLGGKVAPPLLLP